MVLFYTLMPVSPRAIWKPSIKLFSPNFLLLHSIAQTIFFNKSFNVSNLLCKTTGMNGWFGTCTIVGEKITVTMQPLAANAVNVSINSLVSQSTNNYLSFLEDINLEAKQLQQKKFRKNLKQYESEDRAEFFASFIGSLFIVFICSWGFKNMPTGLMNDSYLLTTLFFVLKWIFIYPLMGVFLIVGSLCAPYFFFKMFMPTKNSKEIKIANIELIDNDLENLQSKLIKNIPLFKELLLW